MKLALAVADGVSAAGGVIEAVEDNDGATLSDAVGELLTSVPDAVVLGEAPTVAEPDVLTVLLEVTVDVSDGVPDEVTVPVTLAVVVTVDESVLVPVGEAPTVAEPDMLTVLLEVTVDVSDGVPDEVTVPVTLAVVVTVDVSVLVPVGDGAIVAEPDVLTVLVEVTVDVSDGVPDEVTVPVPLAVVVTVGDCVLVPVGDEVIVAEPDALTVLLAEPLAVTVGEAVTVTVALLVVVPEPLGDGVELAVPVVDPVPDSVPVPVADPASGDAVTEKLVTTMAVSLTRRMRWPSISAMMTAPLASNAIPFGPLIPAEIGGPPSPALTPAPVPANVEMLPEMTARMRLLPLSAIRIVPVASTATAVGELRHALVAGPPSPAKPLKADPATVVMIPVPAATLRMRWFSLSAIKMSPPESTATPVGVRSRASVARAPSPLKPTIDPATMVLIPVPTATLRITLLPVSAINTLPSISTATP